MAPQRAELTTGYDPRWRQLERDGRAWHARTGQARRPASIVDMAWDPITRIIGNLGIYTKIDFDNREVVSCKATSSLFRGYSVFMKGKDPRDAHFITSRICGICGDNHAACSVLRAEHGLRHQDRRRWPSGSSTSARRPSTCSTTSSSRTTWCSSTSASRWSRRPTRACWQKAEKTAAPRRRHPRLQDDRGHHARRSTRSRARRTARRCTMSRLTREMFCLMEGRHVHPSTIYPGGIGTVATPQLFTDYLTRLLRFLDFIKKAVADERRRLRLLLRGAARLRGGRAAARPARLLGRVQEPRRTCDYRYKTMGDWGSEMYVTPGIVVDGELVTTTSSTSTSASGSCSAARYYDDWESEETFVAEGPARQPGRQAPPVEPDDDPEAAEARPRRRQLLAG